MRISDWSSDVCSSDLVRQRRRRHEPRWPRRPVPRHRPSRQPGDAPMNLLALALYAVFAVVAFGWRTWVQWRSTGDTGLRLHADRGSVQWWAKLAFIVAIAAGVVAPIAGLAGVEPLGILEAPTVRIVGVCVAVLGIVATPAAQLDMGSR